MTINRLTRLTVTAVAAGAAALAAAPAAVAGHAPHQAASSAATNAAGNGKGKPPTLPGGYKHLVVIYEENHSFDNLYGSWGDVNGEPVEGLADATAAHTTQIAEDGAPYA